MDMDFIITISGVPIRGRDQGDDLILETDYFVQTRPGVHILETLRTTTPRHDLLETANRMAREFSSHDFSVPTPHELASIRTSPTGLHEYHFSR